MSLTASLASAGPFAIYRSFGTTGTATVAPVANAGSFSATGWVFEDILPVAGYVGEPIWGNTVGVRNTGSEVVSFALLAGIWDANGPNGGPGTRVHLAVGTVTGVQPGQVSAILYSNWPVPAGRFWIGYAFSNRNLPSTTVSQLSTLEFVAGTAPAVGSSNAGYYTSTGVGVYGNNPSVGSLQQGHLASSIQLFQADVPEPSTTSLFMGGLMIVVGLGWRRK